MVVGETFRRLARLATEIFPARQQLLQDKLPAPLSFAVRSCNHPNFGGWVCAHKWSS
jgi:hypothetical protein